MNLPTLTVFPRRLAIAPSQLRSHAVTSKPRTIEVRHLATFRRCSVAVRHILPPPADGRMHGMSQKEEELLKSADVEIKSASSLPPAVRVRLPSRSHRAIAVRCRRRRRRPACLAKPIGSGLSRRSLLSDGTLRLTGGRSSRLMTPSVAGGTICRCATVLFRSG